MAAMSFLRFIIFLSGIFQVLALIGQSVSISGTVMDEDTGEPLAFVNILVNESREGTATDIDGRFSIESSRDIRTLKFTYIGYETKVLAVNSGKSRLRVYLKKSPFELEEVTVLPGINPAHRIIENVVEHRDLNNPEKMRSYSYTAYDKIIFTLDLDSLRMIDTMLLDTTSLKVRRFFDRQDIFIAESVIEHKYLRPERRHKRIIASRVSGMKDPMFIYLVSQIQPASFYRELINIGSHQYVNPVSRGSTGKYIFLLQDTAYTDMGDTVFVISYYPRPGKNFDGLKGMLSVNSNRWAIQNVIAEPAREGGIFSIRIQQKNEFIDGKQWFPVQLNTDVKVKDVVAVAEGKAYSFVGIGKSYIQDIRLDPDLKKREFPAAVLDADPDASDRDEEFWRPYRVDSLSRRDLRTYQFMDSIGEKKNFDRLARTFETLMTGKIPFRIIDFDIDKFIRYNQFEGLYLGLGIHTNDRLSERFNVGGFFGYGFKDKTFKYGGDASILLHEYSEMELKGGYFYDVTESGGVSFIGERKVFLRAEGFRELLIRRMNMTERAYVRLQFRGLKYFKWFLEGRTEYKEAYPDYYYGQSVSGVALLVNEYRFTELLAGFRFAFGEEFIRTNRMRISLGTRYPIVRFQYTHGFDDLLKGEFEYERFDLKITESFYTKYLGLTTIELRAGYIEGDLPYCKLYNGNGSYRRFTIFAANSFATMRMNEFLSNRYLALYFSHNFGTLLVRTRFFSPEIVLATNIAFGDINNRGQHQNVVFNTMEKGYYESGVLFHGLLDLRFYKLGAGLFYRYGPYGFDTPAENFAYKVSIVFPIESVKRK
jgi:hypothetical protein